MLRFASLGSGSEGNALLVESGQTRILIDCGFGHKQAQLRLARLGLRAEDVDAILITHEHSDHIGGAARYSDKFGAKLLMTYGTHWAARHYYPRAYETRAVGCFDSGEVFAVDDIEVTAFPVPHDARQPVQFLISDGDVTLGVLTDVGEITPTIEAALSGCDALVLEANHDEDMLFKGDYPPMLKRRIAGREGHLSNEAAAALLTRIRSEKLQHVLAAHLSRSNNTPELARATFAHALNCTPDWIGIACQTNGFDWREVRSAA